MVRFNTGVIPWLSHVPKELVSLHFYSSLIYLFHPNTVPLTFPEWLPTAQITCFLRNIQGSKEACSLGHLTKSPGPFGGQPTPEPVSGAGERHGPIELDLEHHSQSVTNRVILWLKPIRATFETRQSIFVYHGDATNMKEEWDGGERLTTWFTPKHLL